MQDRQASKNHCNRCGKTHWAADIALAQDGWQVVLHYHQRRQEAEALCGTLSDKGYAIEAISFDLSLAEAPQALIEAASQTGHITALINNASLFSYDCAASVSAEQIARHMAVNLTAPALLTRAVYEQLPVGQTGCVINMLDAKLFGINPDYFSYTLPRPPHSLLPRFLLRPMPRNCG